MEQIEKIAKSHMLSGDCDVDYVKPQPDKSFSVLVDECYRKIEEADHIIAVSKRGGSFGEGTIYEIAFAKHIGKSVLKYYI